MMEDTRPTAADRTPKTTANTEVTASRYSPAYTQPRPDARQVRPQTKEPQDVVDHPRRPVQLTPQGLPVVSKTPDFNDEVQSRSYPKQRSSAPDPRNEPAFVYQNGPTGRTFYDREYPVGHQDLEVSRRRETTEAASFFGEQRATTDEVGRYRTTYDERVDTPQSGRLSQAAIMVREMYEDGEFDQDVAVSRGSHVSVSIC